MLRPHTDYYYNSISAKAYLMLNGDESLVHHIIKRLQESQIAPVRFGSSSYVARNGRKYDWFVHVQMNDGTKPTLQQMYQFIDGYNLKGRQPGISTQRIAELQEQLANERAQLSEISQNHQQVEQQRAELDQQRRDLEDELEFVRLEKADAEERAEADKQFVAAFSHNLEDTQNLLYMQQEENERLKAEIKDLKRTGHLSNGGGIDYGAYINALLPSVRMMWDSEETLQIEYADPMPALGILGRIAAEVEKLDPVAAAEGWFEARCSTGNKHDGRIYFTKRLADGTRRVLISHKQEQERDIDRLKLNPA